MFGFAGELNHQIAAHEEGLNVFEFDDDDDEMKESSNSHRNQQKPHVNNIGNNHGPNTTESVEEASCPSAVVAMMNDSRLDIFMRDDHHRNEEDDDDDEENDEGIGDKPKSNNKPLLVERSHSSTSSTHASSSASSSDLNKNIPSYPPPVFDPSLPSCCTLFSTLCKCFEKLSTATKHKQKSEILDTIFMKCRKDLFQFMRLLLPQLDRERMTYGLKESKIAKYYIEILALPQTCEDALRLKKWKDPSKGTGNSFSDICFQVLQKRGWTSSSNLTVFHVNEKLSLLASCTDNDKKKKILLDLLKNTSCFEQKWILRIILKDLRIGIQHTTIFKQFHPHALELFNSCTDLREVITKCLDPKFTSTVELRVFTMFTPMLASLLTPAKLTAELPKDDFVIEPKYDGERILVHKKESEVKFFTRKGIDYTNIYGPKFAPIIVKNVKAKVCILDGEFLIWNRELEAFKEFGHNRTHALSDTSESNEQFCYMVFDIVYLKDRDITQYALQKRRAYLESVINPVGHVLEIVPQKPVTSEKEVYEQLDQAILNRDEGIMLKGLSGTYVPGERKWMKLKPDSVDGMGETLDLIIIGGFYGTKFKRKSVSHFLLAVATKSKHTYSKTDGFENLDDDLLVNDETQVFHSFCKVGSGYSNSELLALQKELEPHWKPFDKTKLPKFYGSWIPGAGELPDVYIEPKNSKILEIKGYSFQDSTKFKTGITLRFPRVVSIRNDKDWNDCLDLPGLEEMIELSKNGINKRKAAKMDSVISHNDVKKQKRKKNATTTVQNSDGTLMEVAASAKNRRPTAAVSQFFDHDMSKLEKTSTLFKGMQFVVFNGDENVSKYEIEKLIVSNGGSKVQNPNDHENQYLIAANTNNITVKNWIASSKEKKNPLGDRDIIHYKWIIDSVSQSSIQRLHPGYMIYTSERTQYSFKEQMDEFQDEYLFDATEESIKVSLQLTKNSREFMIADSDIIETINARYNIKTSTSFFKGIRAYIDKFVKIGDASSGIAILGMETLEVFISLYGGSVSERLDSSVTHIVYDEDDTSRLRTLKRVATKEGLFLVPREWIMSCVQAKKLQAIPTMN